MTDTCIDGVAVRVYEPQGEARATLVWAHGGSFVRGNLDWPEADWVSKRFAERGVRVLSVDYVLASETVKAPEPADDVARVLRRARSTYPGSVVVGGASAGGYLATAAALQHPGDADALLLLYPTLHRVQRADAGVEALTRDLPEGKQFNVDRIAAMFDFYLGTDDDSAGNTQVIGGLDAAALAELPPTSIVAAERDDLRVSAEMFTEQLGEAGVNVSYAIQPGTLHGFANSPESSDQAARDTLAAVDTLMQGLDGQMPSAR